MLSTTEETIRKAMESVSSPEHLERVKKLRDFAFVHFTDRDSAKAAMEYWDKKELDGSIVEITWAKPANKIAQQKLKRITYGGHPQMQYVLPPGMGPAATYHAPFMKVYDGRGTEGGAHAQSPSSWRGGRAFFTVPRPLIGPKYSPRATEALSEYCHKNNWGDPYFSLMSIPSPQEDNVYMCQVIIPQYPGDQSRFQTPRICFSVEEAKILAAEVTLSELNAAGQTAVFTEGYSHNSVVQPGHVMPQLPTATYTAGTGLQTQPELAIAYALPPNHSSGYLVHGKVTGYDTQFSDTQY